MDWMSPQEAANYFGVTIEDLDEFALEHDLEVRVDGHDMIQAVGTAKIKQALFDHHKRQHGYRPDDPDAMVKARQRVGKRDETEKHTNEQHKQRLKDRFDASHHG